MTDPIFKGDNTGAFGNNFITINLVNPDGHEISKVIFVCGCIKKEFKNPVFPLVVNLTSQETDTLKTVNTCYLVAYDTMGRQKTCQGTLTFKAIPGVIQHGTRC